MLACFAPHVFLYACLLAVLALGARHYAAGKCPRCDERRKPKCHCPGGDPKEPTIKRPDFRL